MYAIDFVGSHYTLYICFLFMHTTHTTRTAVARKALLALIQSTKEILGDSERISGKWVKDDRQKVNALCTEKGAWLEHNLEASLSSIEEQVTNFNERFAPHLAKLAPPENN